MNDSRPAPQILPFALATGAVSAAACLQSYLTRRSGGAELDMAIFARLFAFTDDWGAALQVLIVLLVAVSPPVRSYGARLALAIADRPWATAVAAVAVFALGILPITPSDVLPLVK